MHLKVDEVEASLSRVEWIINIRYGDSDELKRRFRLGHCYHPGAPILELSCNFKMCRDQISEDSEDSEDSDCSEENTKTSFEISLQLSQAFPTIQHNVTDIDVDDGCLENVNQHRPSKVWVSVNSFENKQLMKLTESPCSAILGKWNLNKFIIDLLPHSKRSLCCNLKFPLICVFWIQFETFGEGAKSVVKNISDMFTLQTNCDIQFCFAENQRIGGHMNILSARSRVFAAMFQHKMMESTTGTVKIEDFELDMFKQLLHFVYSGRFSKLLNEDAALTLLTAADKYEIEDLKKPCIDYLQQTVNINNAIRILIWAHLHSSNTLKETTLAFIASNGKTISQLQDWESLTVNYPVLSVQATRRMLE